jgi:hypothetical protein
MALCRAPSVSRASRRARLFERGSGVAVHARRPPSPSRPWPTGRPRIADNIAVTQGVRVRAIQVDPRACLTSSADGSGAGDEDPAFLDQQRRMARGMRLMLDDPDRRAIPGNPPRLGGQAGNEAEQVQRHLLGDVRRYQPGGDAGLGARVGQPVSDGGGAAGRAVTGRRAERSSTPPRPCTTRRCSGRTRSRGSAHPPRPASARVAPSVGGETAVRSG